MINHLTGSEYTLPLEIAQNIVEVQKNNFKLRVMGNITYEEELERSKELIPSQDIIRKHHLKLAGNEEEAVEVVVENSELIETESQLAENSQKKSIGSIGW